jgi:hypothetical protein
LPQYRPHSSFLLHPFLRFPCLVPRDYHLPFLPRFRARITTPHRKAVRMGQHCWLLLATVLTEILAITKWSKGLFPEPLPEKVFWAWVVGGMALVIYPTVNVRVLLLFFAAPVLLFHSVLIPLLIPMLTTFCHGFFFTLVRSPEN